MRALQLVGHYGAAVEVDLCEPCHLLWFDSLEASRLTGPSMLELIGAMAHAQREPHHALEPGVRCPRCRGKLKTVVNRSRFGAAEQLECARGHGMWASFAQWLAERGLMRPLTSADRAALRSGGSADWCCVNCGAPLGSADASTCSHCGTLVGVLDIARLATALDPEGATESESVHRSARERHTFRCHACGHSAAGQHGLACPQCGATQISTDLRQVHARVAHLEAPLREHQQRPAPHVVQRRMQALQSDLGRRRETVRDLERSARPDHPAESAEAGGGWPALLDVLIGRAGVPWSWRVGFWVAVGLFVAWFLGG
jgi:protein-arginine kinase activator protein McsA